MNRTQNLPASAERLAAVGVLRTRWGLLVGEAEKYLAPDVDPWTVHTVDLADGRIPATLPVGPLVYATISHGSWMYVGQTTRALATRMREHGRDSSTERRRTKCLDWSAVVALPLDSQIPQNRLDQIERAGYDYLNPRTGSRWPSRR